MMQNLRKYQLVIAALLLLTGLVAAQGWQPRAPMPTPRRGATAVTLNGKVWVIGGMQTGHSTLDVVEVYDPQNNSWDTSQPHLLNSRGNATARVWNGKIYLFGGRHDFNLVSEVEMFDPAAGQWQVVSSLPTPRFGAASVVVDSAIWIIGGTDMSNANFNLVEIYYPASNTWQTLPAQLNVARGDPMAAYIDGAVYVFGGYYFGPVSSYEKYDPVGQSWSVAGNLLYSCGSAGYVTAAGRAWLTGGIGQSGVLDKVQNFRLENGTPVWENGPLLHIPRRELAAAEAGGKIYTFGGRGNMGHQILNVVEALDLVVGIGEPGPEPPRTPLLAANYPNPFNNSTVLQVSLPRGEQVQVSVLNPLGQTVARIYSGRLSAGTHRFPFRADNLAGGIYLLRVRGESASLTHKLLLAK